MKTLEPIYPVLEFCKENNIENLWNFDIHDKNGWSELLINGKLVMQIESIATVEQFKEVMKLLIKDYNCTDFDEIVGDDFWFNTTDDEGLFHLFVLQHGYLFE